MHIRRTPDTHEKLTRMGDVTLYEPAGDVPTSEKRVPSQSAHLADCIMQVQTPTGPKPVMKTMVTTACERNCFYCPFRAGRAQTERLSFRPDELAKTFDEMQRARVVDGLFLSSGIIRGGVTTQDKIIDTVEIIRQRYGYRGYIHMKIMPGAEPDQLLRSMQLADRVSINLEGATEQRLQALAPRKHFYTELLALLQQAAHFRQTTRQRLASVVTQFVVGAVGDTDLELLAMSERLYQQLGLARAYYSAFHPVVHTPFEQVEAVAPMREYRLYQSSFLLRDYGWELEDLPFVDEGNLRLDTDPKRAWAEINLLHQPVDLMRADRELLLRVPGVGPKVADAILRERRQRALRDMGDLRRVGVRTPEQLAPYILLDGRRLPQQLSLFDDAK